MAATWRGTTSRRVGSVPREVSALTCSVTFMEPSSAAIMAPLRPASISPVMTGPISRIVPTAMIRPIRILAPNGSSFVPHSSASTSPMKSEERKMSGSALTPRTKIRRRVSRWYLIAQGVPRKLLRIRR